MKISFNWLREYVDCGPGPADIADRLTRAGLEVEAVVEVSPPLGEIVVAEVLTVEKHPSADRLSLCRVSDGGREFTVVCGAPNVRAGIRAPFARVGTRLPGGDVLRAAAIRGIVSQGMLCSERELELGDDAEGIMELGAAAAPGTALPAALGLDDFILDIAVTPNRPDCLSVVGVAREVSALLEAPLKIPAVHLEETGERTSDHVRVEVADRDLCPRYTARLIRNVSVGPSPFRVRYRLGMAGVRPVNNVVDATNYVLMERGQPLHAFDFDKVGGGEVRVRTARPGEGIVTIDGRERALTSGMLVIADAARPIAVAGVMGGLDTEVGPGTANILLESAYFDPRSVRRTSKELNLSSDSSYRFERGVDIRGTASASDRAAALIAEIAGGEVCAGIVDEKGTIPAPRRITLRVPRLNSVLHTRLSRRTAKNRLARLGMKAEAKGEKAIGVTVPSYRVDLRREIDLIEEVARLTGYDRIVAVPPRGIAAAKGASPEVRGRERVREALCSLGFSEAICLGFIGEGELSLLGGPAAVRLANPVSEEFELLRPSLLPPLMRCVSLNVRRGSEGVRLFELGSVFIPSGGDNDPPEEEERLALAATGTIAPPNWCTPPRHTGFFFLKGVLEALLGRTGSALTAEGGALAGCHPGRAARLFLEGEAWGWMGELHPGLADRFGIGDPVIFAEVKAGPLFRALTKARTYSPLPRFPAVKRDVAVTAGMAVEAREITDAVRAAAPGLIRSVTIFDLYTGEQVPAGRKGIALSVLLRSEEKTLEERDISSAMVSIRAALEKIGCEIR